MTFILFFSNLFSTFFLHYYLCNYHYFHCPRKIFLRQRYFYFYYNLFLFYLPSINLLLSEQLISFFSSQMFLDFIPFSISSLFESIPTCTLNPHLFLFAFFSLFTLLIDSSFSLISPLISCYFLFFLFFSGEVCMKV